MSQQDCLETETYSEIFEDAKAMDSFDQLDVDGFDFSAFDDICVDHKAANPLCPKCYCSLDFVVERIEERDESKLLFCTNGTRVILSQNWFETKVYEWEKIRVLTLWQNRNSKTVEISAGNGALLTYPDMMLSVGKVAGFVFCRRKIILDGLCPAGDSVNSSMFAGSMAHRIFQKAVTDRISDMEALVRVAEDFLNQPDAVQTMFLFDINVVSVYEALKVPLQSSCNFTRRYLIGRQPLPINQPEPVYFDGVLEIEDEMNSFRYGMTGVSDVVIQVRQNNCVRRMPLELKTGRTANSLQHVSQVKMYTMLISHLYNEICERGLLFYMGDEKMQLIKTQSMDIFGLIMLRNEIMRYFGDYFRHDKMETALPPVISNLTFCQQCSQRFACCLLSTGSLVDEQREAFCRTNTGHLSDSDLAYFEKWMRWLRMEAVQATKDLAVFNGFADNKCVQCTLHSQSADERELTLRVDAGYADTFLVAYDRVLLTSMDGGRVLTIGSVRIAQNDVIKVFIFKKSNLRIGDRLIVTHYVAKFPFSVSIKSLFELMQDSKEAKLTRNVVIDLRKSEQGMKFNASLVYKMKDIIAALNVDQVKSILKVIAAQKYCLIKGYPGSGKSSTIVALIRVLIRQNVSVLICSHTNCAVDNVLIKLKEYTTDILRLGVAASVHPEIREFMPEVKGASANTHDLASQLFMSPKIVGATCTTICSHPLFQCRRFQLCIIDEATLVSEVFCLKPLLVSDKFVLVGDPLQLQPLVVSDAARKEGMDVSLFSRLETEHPECVFTLRRQYRMNKVICNLSNTLFYNGQLKSGCDKVDESVIHFNREVEVEEQWLHACLSLQMHHSVVFVDTSELENAQAIRRGPSAVDNSTEAHIVHRICDTMLKFGIEANQIGVISPYRNQMDTIRLVLGKLCANNGGGIEVNTIDQFQGKDKDIIFLSLVWTRSLKSNEDSTCHLLKNEKRMNVALTRAKKKLILIGHLTDLGSHVSVIGRLQALLTAEQIVTPRDLMPWPLATS